MPQTGEVSVRVSSKLSSAFDLSSVVSELNKTFSTSLTNGTGANQASNVWHDQRTLLTASNENLDFAGGSLSNALGAALTFTEIKAIIIYALPANTGKLTVSSPAGTGVPFMIATGGTTPTPKFDLFPGGLYVYTNPSDAGITVTASTGDIINIDNATGASQSYQIIVYGVA